MTTRRSRAADTQRIAARFACLHGFPWASPVGAGAPGRDIYGMPGLAPEVKARRDFSLTGSLKQAIKNAGEDLPFVICRPDGYGPERIADWPAVIRYADLIALLRAAGYGDPPRDED
jgi:hypothetical protein